VNTLIMCCRRWYKSTALTVRRDIGGANTYGTIFEITSTGTQKTLYGFAGPDGAYPYAALIQATDGDFYGTTYGGTRASGDGTVFRFTPGQNGGARSRWSHARATPPRGSAGTVGDWD
jgi:uncharacterized repeat protein (TIGR03803 family)